MTAECQLCGDTVEASALTEILPGYRRSPNRSAIRWFDSGGYALLHHRCSHHTVRDMIDPDVNWFACQQPDRAVDIDAVFDAACPKCEQRWVQEGHTLWNRP